MQSKCLLQDSSSAVIRVVIGHICHWALGTMVESDHPPCWEIAAPEGSRLQKGCSSIMDLEHRTRVWVENDDLERSGPWHVFNRNCLSLGWGLDNVIPILSSYVFQVTNPNWSHLTVLSLVLKLGKQLLVIMLLPDARAQWTLVHRTVASHTHMSINQSCSPELITLLNEPDVKSWKRKQIPTVLWRKIIQPRPRDAVGGCVSQLEATGTGWQSLPLNTLSECRKIPMSKCVFSPFPDALPPSRTLNGFCTEELSDH